MTARRLTRRRTQRRRRTWLGPIRVLLLLLLPHGAIQIGRAFLGGVIVPGSLQNRFPELMPSEVTLWVPRVSYGQYLLDAIGHELAFSVVTIPILIYARRLTYEAMTGDPFTPRMVHRLRTLGAMVLVGGLLLRTGASIDKYPTLWWVLPGLILLAVSEVVRRGCDLRAELDGVI